MDWTAQLLSLFRNQAEPGRRQLARHAHLPLQSGADAILRELPAARLGLIAEERKQLGSPVHWLDRTQAEAGERSLRQNGAHQSLKRARWRKVAAPAAEIDAGEHQLNAPAPGEFLNRAQAGLQGHGPAVTARSRDHTEGAAVPAAVLYLEIRTRLATAPRPNPRHGQHRMRESVIDVDALRPRCGLQGVNRNEARWGNQRRRGKLRDQSLVAVAQNRMDPGESRHLLRRALRIATRHQDAGRWVLAMQAAQKGASSPIGLRGNAAGIYHHYIGQGRIRGWRQTAVAQLRADGFPIRLVGAASEVRNVVFCHVASLSTGLSRHIPRVESL